MVPARHVRRADARCTSSLGSASAAEVWLFGEQQGSQQTSSFGAGRNPNG